MAAVGADTGLRSGERDSLDALGLQRHGHQRAAHVLTGGQQQVHLARIGFVGDGRGQLGEMVGGIAHGADDDHQVRAIAAIPRDAAGDVADALGVSER